MPQIGSISPQTDVTVPGHLHAPYWYQDTGGNGATVDIPNTGAYQRILNANGSEMGSTFAMTAGMWAIGGALTWRANSPNWTTIIARTSIFTTGGGAVSSDAQAVYALSNSAACDQGFQECWLTVGFSPKYVIVPGGSTYMLRMEVRTVGPFGAFYSRGYQVTYLNAWRVDAI